MTIYKKMAQILAETTAISKSKKNQAQGFMFRGIDDVMNELHDTFAKNGVFITTETLELIREEGTTKNGGVMHHQFQKIKFTFNADDGTSISSIVWGEAMDSGDKASNKCMSIALKYALLQAFLIPTEDMVDPDSQCHQVAGKAQAKEQKTNSQPAPGAAKRETQTAKENAPELYTGTNQQKVALKNICLSFGLQDADKAFMVRMSEECQRMPMAQIGEYIKPRAEKYMAEIDIPTEVF